ncbi:MULTISPECIES: peptidoglycan DD-metalloendopeptidase family protein [unclassified Halomonas]|uniref:peptidoglycan DD-metalloendopeptidase family protein n=1 Tax=unclassified Halomonas TaxID=2609666 RepID=UPI001EF6AD0C|nr:MULTISPECIES: peptidoglycan DD-metalloendopeptidase family protein [unclassified Halomonas]MCG7576132.1 peptidoglycan DD-metalloendopeptidase family protein [Halomonas sp. MMH1-48]MCG7603089.1 peptidoglycan DD-metalloendopeptidase family protein [Halomonas sp. MM17-34]MCG7612339.1 peptidoglycan DD-metalloendopeptidase family protein [Halomonas sp. MM17-29]MCG7619220.1 peptidoglycan DD-metalloendopeptidase family protein [Halomonas sp. DSH1-27]
MRKVFMMTVLALAVSGCASQQSNTPQVRDLSDARRAVENSPQYTVKAGDTLYGIAWQHNLDYRQLAAINNIDAPYQIYPGQTIALREGAGGMSTASGGNASPASTSGAVATGLQPQATAVASNDQELDWLLPDESAIERNQRLTVERAERTAVEASQQVAAATEASEVAAPQQPSTQPEQEPEPERAPAPEPEPTPAAAPEPAAEPAQAARTDRSSRTFTPAENIDWRWPTDGQVTGEFGQGGSITAGIDIAGQKGQPVRAAGPGIVVYAGSGVRGYGNLILLKHNDQFLSAYAHNDSLSVKENDVVEAGEVIATMGDSDADAVKLHFEVRRDGQPQNPLDYLPSR